MTTTAPETIKVPARDGYAGSVAERESHVSRADTELTYGSGLGFGEGAHGYSQTNQKVNTIRHRDPQVRESRQNLCVIDSRDLRIVEILHNSRASPLTQHERQDRRSIENNRHSCEAAVRRSAMKSSTCDPVVGT